MLARSTVLLGIFVGGAFILAGCWPSIASAEEPKLSEEGYADKILKELNEKFHAIHSSSVETLTTTYSKGKFIIQEGVLLEATDNRWRWTGSTYTGRAADEFLVVSDGTVVWSQTSALPAVLKRLLDQTNQPALSRSFVTSRRGLRVLGKTTFTDGKAVYEIETQSPKVGAHGGANLVRCWIGVDDGLLYGVTEYDGSGNEISTTIYKNYKINIPIDPSEFQFHVPSQTQILDLTMKNRGAPLKAKTSTTGLKPQRE